MKPKSFYIGYLPSVPREYAKPTWVAACLMALFLIAAMGMLAASQEVADAGTYEFGVLKPREGFLRTDPVPMLTVGDQRTGSINNYLLVGATKEGPPAEFLARAGEQVRFDGTLVRRGSQLMLEVGPAESWQFLGAPSSLLPPPKQLGTMTLRGELIDTKCFFGAMRPAVGKIHRGCAVRCLSGGIPPALRVVDDAGNESIVLLAGRSGTPAPVNPEWAGLFIDATGPVEVDGNTVVMRLDVARPVRK
ncbi:hypothetical protein GC173_10670 [bacterium]|nr:hypothetical protein [bacterium]